MSCALSAALLRILTVLALALPRRELRSFPLRLFRQTAHARDLRLEMCKPRLVLACKRNPTLRYVACAPRVG